MFFFATGLSASVPGFPQYVTGLGAGLATVGILVALLGVGNIIADLPAGALIHRFGDRRVIIVSSALAGVAAFGTAATSDLGVVAFFRVVIGLSHSTMLMSMMAYVRHGVPRAARGRSLAFLGGALRLGFLFGPLAGGFLAEHYGVPAAFVLQGIVSGAATLSILISPGQPIPSDGGPAETGNQFPRQAHTPGSAGILKALLRERGKELSVVAFVVFTLMLLRQGRNIVFPLWGEHLGLSISAIGAVMGASAAVELFLFIPAGWLMDHAGRRPTITLCVGLMALGIAALPLTGGAVGYLLAGLVVGIGNGFGSGIVMTLGTDFAPDGAVGPFLGVWRLFGDTGAAVGPFAVGAVAASLTLPASLAATGAVGLLAATLMLVFGPETRGATPTLEAES
jgi:MFS family permease